MKAILGITLAAVSAVGLAGAAYAATATADSSATVVAPITVAKTADLAFGAFAPTGVNGTVTITDAGARSAVDVDLITSASGAASFTVTGQPTFNYNIAVTDDDLTDGSNSMVLTTTQSVASGSGVTIVGVGGSIGVGAAQPAGDYEGDVTLTAIYS